MLRTFTCGWPTGHHYSDHFHLPSSGFGVQEHLQLIFRQLQHSRSVTQLQDFLIWVPSDDFKWRSSPSQLWSLQVSWSSWGDLRPEEHGLTAWCWWFHRSFSTQSTNRYTQHVSSLIWDVVKQAPYFGDWNPKPPSRLAEKPEQQRMKVCWQWFVGHTFLKGYAIKVSCPAQICYESLCSRNIAGQNGVDVPFWLSSKDQRPVEVYPTDQGERPCLGRAMAPKMCRQSMLKESMAKMVTAEGIDRMSDFLDKKDRTFLRPWHFWCEAQVLVYHIKRTLYNYICYMLM